MELHDKVGTADRSRIDSQLIRRREYRLHDNACRIRFRNITPALLRKGTAVNPYAQIFHVVVGIYQIFHRNVHFASLSNIHVVRTDIAFYLQDVLAGIDVLKDYLVAVLYRSVQRSERLAGQRNILVFERRAV